MSSPNGSRLCVTLALESDLIMIVVAVRGAFCIVTMDIPPLFELITATILIVYISYKPILNRFNENKFPFRRKFFS